MTSWLSARGQLMRFVSITHAPCLNEDWAANGKVEKKNCGLLMDVIALSPRLLKLSKTGKETGKYTNKKTLKKMCQASENIQ